MKICAPKTAHHRLSHSSNNKSKDQYATQCRASTQCAASAFATPRLLAPTHGNLTHITTARAHHPSASSMLAEEVELISTQLNKRVHESKQQERKRKKDLNEICRKIGLTDNKQQPFPIGCPHPKLSRAKRERRTAILLGRNSKIQHRQQDEETEKEFERMACMYEGVEERKKYSSSGEKDIKKILAKIMKENQKSNNEHAIIADFTDSPLELLAEIQRLHDQRWKEIRQSSADMENRQPNELNDNGVERQNKDGRAEPKTMTECMMRRTKALFANNIRASMAKENSPHIQNIWSLCTKVKQNENNLRTYFQQVGEEYRPPLRVFNIKKKSCGGNPKRKGKSIGELSSNQRNAAIQTQVPQIFLNTLKSFQHHRDLKNLQISQRAFPNRQEDSTREQFGLTHLTHKKSNTEVLQPSSTFSDKLVIESSNIRNIFDNHSLRICEKVGEIEKKRRKMRVTNSIGKGKALEQRKPLGFTPCFQKIVRYF